MWWRVYLRWREVVYLGFTWKTHTSLLAPTGLDQRLPTHIIIATHSLAGYLVGSDCSAWQVFATVDWVAPETYWLTK